MTFVTSNSIAGTVLATSLMLPPDDKTDVKASFYCIVVFYIIFYQGILIALTVY